MEHDLLLGLRNALAFCMLFTVASTIAEARVDLSALLLDIWKRFKQYRRSWKKRPAGTSSKKFWEIDMTKFEP